MQIVDKFNEVGNNFATSSGDIGEGLKRSSAALSAAGNDIDQSIALFTASQEITQDADVVGTALKTISMRLRGTKSDLSEAGVDTEGMADSVSKLRDEVLALSGVDIQESPDQYKDTYTILQEMSKVWHDLTDMGRANILELFFGKRQANIGAALLENFKTAEEVLETSRNSAGSAEKENAKYLASVQGHLDQLQAKWQTFSATIAESAGLKVLIDGAGAVVSVLDNLTDTFGAFTMVATPALGMLSKVGNIGRKYALLQQGRSSCRMMAA